MKLPGISREHFNHKRQREEAIHALGLRSTDCMVKLSDYKFFFREWRDWQDRLYFYDVMELRRDKNYDPQKSTVKGF